MAISSADIEIYPQAAATAGCSATATIVESYETGNAGPALGFLLMRTSWKRYSFAATPAAGWMFDHWEQTYDWKPYGSNTSVSSERLDSSDTPWETSHSTVLQKETTVDDLIDCFQESSETPYYESTRTITGLRAVFVQGSILHSATSSLILHGSSGFILDAR